MNASELRLKFKAESGLKFEGNEEQYFLWVEEEHLKMVNELQSIEKFKNEWIESNQFQELGNEFSCCDEELWEDSNCHE